MRSRDKIHQLLDHLLGPPSEDAGFAELSLRQLVRIGAPMLEKVLPETDAETDEFLENLSIKVLQVRTDGNRLSQEFLEQLGEVLAESDTALPAGEPAPAPAPAAAAAPAEEAPAAAAEPVAPETAAKAPEPAAAAPGADEWADEAPVNYNDRCLILGKTTSGKSELARYLFSAFTGCRRVCVNVKGLADVGVPAVSDPGAVDWTAPVINFVPRSSKQELYEELYAGILAHGGPTVVWLDEAFGPTTGNRAPDSLIMVQTQGAQRGIGHLVCSQRPENIAVPLRTEAEHVWIFVPPISYNDLEAIAREIAYLDDAPCGPRELADLLRSVQAKHGLYSSVWWNRATGELVECEPLPASVVGAPLQQPRAPAQRSSAQELEPVPVSGDTPDEPADQGVEDHA
jgi:hypothetical protein